jgi:hypothetical protein
MAILKQVRILSIDAWREGNDWTWNNWFDVGRFDLSKIDSSNRSILKFLRDEGYLKKESAGKITIEDDGYNLVIKNKNNLEPLFAIEYGGEVFESEGPDRVLFVNFKGEILALFPDMPESQNRIMSYARLGQHGPACKSLLRCKRAKSEDFESLKKELGLVGYKLEIMN